MRRGDQGAPRWGERGIGLLIALLAVAAAAAGSTVVATDWTQQIQRDKEAELLRVGDLYARAIASYHRGSPGSTRRYPPDLNTLLEDRRFVNLHRHLRSPYLDPITGSADWGLVRADDGGIKGVFSRSDKLPWRRMPVTLAHSVLPAAQQYSDWKFIARVE